MAAVKDFIEIDDAKLIIEKPVKQKPSIQELTKIEVPGRPVPATNFSKKKRTYKKKTTKKKTSKKKTTKKTISKTPSLKRKISGDYTLIITEKPQAAQKIASALGTPRKFSEPGGASYFEVSHNKEKIVVASAVGHLFNLDYVEGQKGYPIFELEWRPSYEKPNAAFTRKYYSLLKALAKNASDYIIATDYDIEGEVIGWNVLRFICGKETSKRMKYSTLTKTELEKSFNNLMKEPNWGQAYAGETRHILDWLFGINLSRALMASIKHTGSFKILSIGRVQGPALKIIVEREKEIDAFKPEPYWQVFADVGKTKLKHPKDIFDKAQLDKFKSLKEGIAETKEKVDKLPPNPPFDLTSLQRDAYRYHRVTPSQTLRIAQKLYLEGLISYPRTSSQKIPESIEPQKILKQLSKNYPQLTKHVTKKKPLEGKKSDPAHPSIYPTGEYRDLEGQEENLYKLILKRFISVFCDDAEIKNKRINLKPKENPELNFTASGNKILKKGWLDVYPTKIEESEVETLNGDVKIDKISFEEKETQPPKRYSPTSLVTTLEKKNLGTKATRSSIVDTLFDRGYLDGTSIKATPLGIKLIETLEKFAPIIIDEKLTREIEEEMEQILDSKDSFKEKEDKIIKKNREMLEKIGSEFKEKEKLIGESLQKGLLEQRKEQDEQNTLMTCPECKQGKLKIIYSPKTKRQFVACDKYPDCKTTFSLPPNSLIKNTGKKNEDGLPLLIAIRKGKRPWEFPFNPNWKAEQENKSS